MPMARRGPRAMAAPSSVPPTPANGIEHQLAGLAEELDESRHQPRRLVRAMGLAGRVAELRRIGRRQHRLREVEPLLAGQLVELVGGMGRTSAVGHAVQRSPHFRGPTADHAAGGPLECRHARQVHERAVRRARRRVHPARIAAPVGVVRRGRRAPDRWHGRRRSRPASSTRRSAASAGLQEPMLVVRGGAYGPGTDRPYAPFIRALRPVLAELSDAELGAVVGSATDELVRLLPELERAHRRQRPMAPRVRLTHGPRAPPGAPARGRPRRPRPPVRATAGPVRHRGPAPRRRRDPHAGELPGPDRPVPSGSRSSGTYQADAIRRDDPWAGDLRALEARATSAGPPVAAAPRAATNSSGSSRRSRASGRRRASSSSSRNDRAGDRSSPRSCWRRAASFPRSP